MTFSFEAIGTHWQIDIHPAPKKELSLRSTDIVRSTGRTKNDVRLTSDWCGVHESRTTEAYALLQEKIKNRIAGFDKHYSRFRDDSLVSEMARNAGSYTLPDDARLMMGLYETLYAATDGAFTPLIGSVLVEAGYDAKYALVPGELHAPKQWNDVMNYQYPDLVLKEPALLDFGALGKGYLVDVVGELIEREGIMSYAIDAGGDIRHRGVVERSFTPHHRDQSGKVLRVGLEHPNDKTKVVGVIEVANKSICCSAGNRRAWAQYHHIINPHTLSSPKHILSTWVTAGSTLLADGIATSLFFVPPERLISLFQFEYCILNPDYSAKKSSGFDAELFIR